MRHLLLLVLLTPPLASACSSGKPADSTTTVTTVQDPSQPPTAAGPPPVTELQPHQAQPAVVTPAPPRPQPAPVKKPLYSCFSYLAVNTTAKKFNCMRTPDCPDLLEQAKGIKGIRELSGCASVASVWCFHQLVKGDPEGADVCQPSAEECAASRTAAVKSKESVDTDCAQR